MIRIQEQSLITQMPLITPFYSTVSLFHFQAEVLHDDVTLRHVSRFVLMFIPKKAHFPVEILMPAVGIKKILW